MTGDPKRVLVYGWYGQSNLGDDLFVEAFRRLFPDYRFKFTNRLTSEEVDAADAVFFGGGSFLDNRISGDMESVGRATQKPVVYFGVGTETAVHPDHLMMMSAAGVVAARGRRAPPGAILIPDIVYCLPREPNRSCDKTVLFVPNVSVLPSRSDPHWKRAAWEYFKSECSQFLDELVWDGYEVRTTRMCRSECLDDSWPAAEIVGQMEARSRKILIEETPADHAQAVRLFSSFRYVVTQRYHGLVLGEMSGAACVSISHHDKLRGAKEGSAVVPYYGVTKTDLRRAMESAVPTVQDRADDRAFSVACTAVRQYLGG